VTAVVAAQIVAGLYVEPAGVYSEAENVELWDKARDARLYAGPWPVVAHPPCARWCALAPLLQSMHGYMIGDDGGCFKAALNAVRRFGGVLEHPAHSLAWRRFALPRPGRHGWTTALEDPGMTCEVDQAAYGHPARKRTWLYGVGVAPLRLRWHTPAASRMVSSFGHNRRVPETERVRPRLASATPPAFRDELLALARTAYAAPLEDDVQEVGDEE
jgi:hypothetical protein